MALEKTSEPGISTLLPTCKPEIDITIEESREVIPTTRTERMVYSFGTFAVCNAKRSGSTDVIVVSCENDTEAAVQKTRAKTKDRYRCMVKSSVSKAMLKLAVWWAN